MGRIIKDGIMYAGSVTNAKSIRYDNSDSNLDATNIKDAIDELASGDAGAITLTEEEYEALSEEEQNTGTYYIIDDDDGMFSEAELIVYYNDKSGLVSENVQDAIDEISGKVDNNTSEITTLKDALTDEITTRQNAISTEKAERQNAVLTEKSERQAEIAVERERINQFTRLAEGSTTGDAELIDARVDYKGNIHANMGEHIRRVTSNLSQYIEELKELMIYEDVETTEDWIVGYWKIDGSENLTNNLYRHTKIAVKSGDKLKFNLRNDGNIVSCVYLSSDNAVIDYIDNKIAKSYLDYEITVPSGVSYVCLSSHTSELYNCYKIAAAEIQTLFNEVYDLFDKVYKHQWNGKKWVAYGDSITAISNSDSLINSGWTKYVNETLNFAECYGRGIGGSGYRWKGNGGSASIVNEETGRYISRNDNENKDNYTGNVNAGEVLIRSCFCSWDRITHMIPQSKRESIDLIYIMGGTNDNQISTAPSWVENDTTDVEWANSEFYSQYNGDFNIETMQGGLASTVMKMQVWCPNAIIVIGTPLASRGTTGQNRTDIINVDELEKTQYIKSVSEMLGCPCINVYGTSGINPLNRKEHISDTIHPYEESGKMMLARSVISGLKNIFPKLEIESNNT